MSSVMMILDLCHVGLVGSVGCISCNKDSSAVSPVTRVFNLIHVCMQAPSVDGEFLPRDPAELLSDADYLATNDVLSHDIMLGINNDEGAIINLINEYLKEAVRASDPTADLSEVNLVVNEEWERNLLEDELVYRVGEELLKEPRRLDTLVKVLDFFYTKPLENGQVKAQVGTVVTCVFM